MRTSSTAARALGLAIGIGLVATPLAMAATTDPFTSGIPARDYAPPEGQRYAPGEVNAQSGSASYAIPIALPPGRLGMQPSLALGYSSAGALRGGLAVGWSMDLPFIERDPDFPYGSPHYRVGGQRLVPVTGDPMGGQVYRTEVDGSFTRYQYDPVGGWTVLTADGHTQIFRSAAPNRLYLTEETDTLGNAVRYSYATQTVNGASELYPTQIDYTANDLAGLQAHAKVEFVYAPLESCDGAPVGAAVDYHFGNPRLSGSRRLIEIRASVRDNGAAAWRLARKVTLGYDTTELACSASGLRYLKTVDVSAFTASGVETREPTLRLGYGAMQRTLTRAFSQLGTIRERGTAYGATSGFMDIDGDGRQDYAEVVTDSRCHLRWYRGLPDGQFATTSSMFDLPSAEWLTPGAPDPNWEHCTLSGQVALRPTLETAQVCVWRAVTVPYAFMDLDGDGDVDLLSTIYGSIDAGGDFAAGTAKQAANNHSGCPSGTIEGAPDANGNVICSCPRSGDVYDHLAGRCVAPRCSNGSAPNALTGACDLPGFETPPPDPTGTGPSGPLCSQSGFGPRAGDVSYPWFVQHMEGGAPVPFAEHTTIDSRIPLPTGSFDLTTASPAMPQLPSLVDIDADGYLDIIDLETPTTAPGATDKIYVWRGLAAGGFAPSSVLWQLRATWAQQVESLSRTDTPSFTAIGRNVELSMRDVNGDGLPDLLFRSQQIWVAYNMAGAAPNPGTPPTLPVRGAFSAPVPLSVYAPLETTRTEAVDFHDDYTHWVTGDRAYVRRLLDIDGDGALDLVDQPTAGSIVAPAGARIASRLVGGATGFTPRGLGGEWEPIEARLTASGGFWRHMSDFIDLTGDGLPDAVTYDETNRPGSTTITTDAAPASLRLLTSIDNGRGGVTRFDYAYTNDATVVTLGGAALPPHRVVKTITVEPGNGQPAMTTQYAYASPISGRASPQDPTNGAFKGFTTVTTTSSGQPGASAKQTVATYDYAAVGNDWGGHLQSRITSINSSGAWVPLEHDAYAYAARPLFGGVSTMTTTATQDHRVCAAGSTAASCATQVEHTTTTTEYQQYPTTGAAAFYLRSVERTTDFVNLERYHRTTYDARYTATRTQLLPAVQDQGGWIDWGGPLFLPAARSETVYDTRGLPVERRVSQDGAINAITKTTFDTVGNPTLVVRPRQVAVNSALGTTIGYDSNKVYATTSLDELSRLVTTKYDTGTGQILEKVGPDSRSTCAPGLKCPTWQWQTERWVRDGLGRELSHERSFDAAAGSYGYVQRTDRITGYYDTEIPTRRVTWTLRDPNAAGGLAWVIDQQRLDGAGRVNDTTALRQVAGSPDAITVYRYDAGGGLASVETPDPRVDTGARVTTTFTRDGAGRPTLITRPDGSTEAIAYRGLETEVTQSGAGQSARTLERRSQFGEVIQRHEFDNPAPGQTAITTYNHDVLGRVDSVASADSTYSSIGYDWAGHRTWVNQSGHVWSFTYDLDGNAATSVEPTPAGASAALYTSKTFYDLVDRPTSTTPATHGLTTSRMTDLGIGVRSQTYRASTDQIATLTLPIGTISYTYDADGNVARETRALKSPTMPATITQWVDRTYDALGTPMTVTWDDNTLYKLTTDARGAVATAQWKNPATSSFETLATYGRAVAGQPRIRAGYDQARSWTYDALGRVTYDWIYRVGSSTSWAQLQTSYDGLGNVAGQSGTAYGLVQDSTYTYDAVRRLTHAVGAGGYDASFTYSAAGNIKTATILGTAQPRAVTYAYGGADPQAVDKLTSIGNGAVVGSFTYDVAGQMISRATPAGSASMAWDPDGILREIASPSGVTRTFVGPGAEKMIVTDLSGITLYFADSETQLSIAGVLNRRYHHVAAGEPIARIETTGTTTKVELQYADTLQNLRLTADKNNVVTAAFTYGAFGEILGSYGATDHKRQFNGKDAEPIAGLRNYGYRSYDPYTLRWISSDPVSTFAPDNVSPQDANRYSFSANNPVRYLDPDGRENRFCLVFGNCAPSTPASTKSASPSSAPTADDEEDDTEVSFWTRDEKPHVTVSGTSATESGSAATVENKRIGTFGLLNLTVGSDRRGKRQQSLSALSWDKDIKLKKGTFLYLGLTFAEVGVDKDGASATAVSGRVGVRQDIGIGKLAFGISVGVSAGKGKRTIGVTPEVGLTDVHSGSRTVDNLANPMNMFSPDPRKWVVTSVARDVFDFGGWVGSKLL